MGMYNGEISNVWMHSRHTGTARDASLARIVSLARSNRHTSTSSFKRPTSLYMSISTS